MNIDESSHEEAIVMFMKNRLIQNQNQDTDQLINLIWFIHTLEVTSVGSYRQLLKN